MLPYIFIMGFNFILSTLLKVNRNQRGRDLYFFLMGIVLILVSGLRSIDIGVDTMQFCTNFVRVAHCSSLLEALLATRYETGFVLFCYVLSRITSNYQILILSSSIIITVSVLKFIKKNSCNVSMSVYIYIAMNFFGMYMNVMRQALAISIFLWTYDLFYKEKKYFKYIVGIVIASTFHSSALVLLVLPFISKISFKTKSMLFMCGITLMLLIFARPIVTQVALLTGYAGYLTKANYFGSNYFGAFFLFLANSIVFLFCFIQKDCLDEQQMEWLKISFVSLMLTLCTMQISIVGRIAEYFNVFGIVLVPNVLRLSKKIKNRIFVKTLLIAFLFLYWIIIAIYRPEWHGVVPYKTMFI